MVPQYLLRKNVVNQFYVLKDNNRPKSGIEVWNDYGQPICVMKSQWIKSVGYEKII